MTRLIHWLSLTALLLALGPAQAEPPQGRGEGKSRQEAAQADRRDEARRDDGREGRRDEQGNRPPPRLSPEERRELRQQIHEAGHDVYHRPKKQQQ